MISHRSHRVLLCLLPGVCVVVAVMRIQRDNDAIVISDTVSCALSLEKDLFDIKKNTAMIT